MFLLGFNLDSQRFGIRLEEVERVLRAVWTPAISDAPDGFVGVLNYHGRMVPVLDIRAKFSFPSRDPLPEDRIILSQIGERSLAFFVDQVEGVFSLPHEEVVEAGDVIPDLNGPIEGFGQFSDDTVFIYSVSNLYSSKELQSFEDAVRKAAEHAP